jgi:transcriptional regulator with XRE-family HTH domain
VYHTQAAILRRVLSREKTKKALADKLGVSREWLDRVLSGEVALGSETCVLIALEYDEDALSLLRAAGKDAFADLLERAGFGAGDVSAKNRALLRDLDSLPDAQQRPIRKLIQTLAALLRAIALVPEAHQRPIRELLHSLLSEPSSPTRKSRRRS